MKIQKMLPIFLAVLSISCQYKKHDVVIKWSPEYKSFVKTTMLKSLSLDKDYNASEINKACNCIVDKYEEFYPGGIKHRIPIDTQIIINKICSPKAGRLR